MKIVDNIESNAKNPNAMSTTANIKTWLKVSVFSIYEAWRSALIQYASSISSGRSDAIKASSQHSNMLMPVMVNGLLPTATTCDADIWVAGSKLVETWIQLMPDAIYGYFFHGACIVISVFVLGRVCLANGFSRPSLNWSGFILAIILCPKIPIYISESATVKLLCLLSCSIALSLAPSYLPKHLASNARQQRYVRIGLIVVLSLLFIASFSPWRFL